jgi:hypothetical protein
VSESIGPPPSGPGLAFEPTREVGLALAPTAAAMRVPARPTTHRGSFALVGVGLVVLSWLIVGAIGYSAGASDERREGDARAAAAWKSARATPPPRQSPQQTSPEPDPDPTPAAAPDRPRKKRTAGGLGDLDSPGESGSGRDPSSRSGSNNRQGGGNSGKHGGGDHGSGKGKD